MNKVRFLPQLFFALLLCSFQAGAQSLKKYPVAGTGCTVYSYCNPGNFNLSYSPDSSKVYVAECVADSMNYGVLCVQLKVKISGMTDAEGLLVAYLDYLKQSLKITRAMGYGKGHKLNNNPKTRGIIDYWEDDTQTKWKVKGWTNGSFIVVLYANSLKELPETKVNLFLDGLRFPGM